MSAIERGLGPDSTTREEEDEVRSQMVADWLADLRNGASIIQEVQGKLSSLGWAELDEIGNYSLACTIAGYSCSLDDAKDLILSGINGAERRLLNGRQGG